MRGCRRESLPSFKMAKRRQNNYYDDDFEEQIDDDDFEELLQNMNTDDDVGISSNHPVATAATTTAHSDDDDDDKDPLLDSASVDIFDPQIQARFNTLFNSKGALLRQIFQGRPDALHYVAGVPHDSAVADNQLIHKAITEFYERQRRQIRYATDWEEIVQIALQKERENGGTRSTGVFIWWEKEKTREWEQMFDKGLVPWQESWKQALITPENLQSTLFLYVTGVRTDRHAGQDVMEKFVFPTIIHQCIERAVQRTWDEWPSCSIGAEPPRKRDEVKKDPTMTSFLHCIIGGEDETFFPEHHALLFESVYQFARHKKQQVGGRSQAIVADNMDEDMAWIIRRACSTDLPNDRGTPERILFWTRTQGTNKTTTYSIVRDQRHVEKYLKQILLEQVEKGVFGICGIKSKGPRALQYMIGCKNFSPLGNPYIEEIAHQYFEAKARENGTTLKLTKERDFQSMCNTATNGGSSSGVQCWKKANNGSPAKSTWPNLLYTKLSEIESEKRLYEALFRNIRDQVNLSLCRDQNTRRDIWDRKYKKIPPERRPPLPKLQKLCVGDSSSPETSAQEICRKLDDLSMNNNGGVYVASLCSPVDEPSASEANDKLTANRYFARMIASKWSADSEGQRKLVFRIDAMNVVNTKPSLQLVPRKKKAKISDDNLSDGPEEIEIATSNPVPFSYNDAGELLCDVVSSSSSSIFQRSYSTVGQKVAFFRYLESFWGDPTFMKFKCLFIF